MLKRIYILILTLLSFGGVALNGAIATGSWKSYPVSGEFSEILETDRSVWYVTGGRLNSYDKKSDETRTYEYGRDLSDFTISKLYFNHAARYLAVVYDNSNIDLVYEDDGTIVNLSEIKDATVNADKGVNDVVFHDNLIYVATDFGLVIFDEKRHEVKESGVYNGHGILSMAALDGGIVMIPSGFDIEASPIIFHTYGDKIHKFDNFRVLKEDAGHRFENLTPLDGNVVAVTQWGNVRMLRVNQDNTDLNYWTVYSELGHGVHELMPAEDGGIYFKTKGGLLLHADKDGVLDSSRYALPEDLRDDVVSTRRGPEQGFWAGDDDGIGQYRLSADGSLTVMREKSSLSEATTFSKICRIYPADNGFIVSNIGQSQYHPSGKGDFFEVPLLANIYRDGVFTNINPDDVSAITPMAIESQRKMGKRIFSPTWICQAPDNPDRLYIASAVEGIYVVDNGKEIAKFDDTNSNIHRQWGISTTFVEIDHQGNLWTASFGGSVISMLPAAKLKGDLSKITSGDWVSVNFGGNIKSKDIHLLICKKSNLIFAYDSYGAYALEVLQHNGTISDTSGHKHVGWSNVSDSDGKSFAPDHWICAIEDQRGHVWFGTTSGVVSVPNPATAMTTSFVVNRIKVPRNDGTNLADYLLESDKILCMAVDHSNRKWIGTENSGLYLVSEDGDEILAVYNTSNSPLPVNTITGLHVDPESNSVFVATMSGLFELSTTSGPAAEDYSEVYAYPNPVTPEYTGWITITGLMDSSMVKIVDADMHLVYQTTSEGGMAMWDGCNMNGSRVRSGVYYVLASSGSETSSKGAVATKILVVN